MKFNRGGVSLSLISDYRTELMGMAAIFIIMVHSVAYVSWPRTVDFVFSKLGYGVDIFLFLSGLGIYYSLSRIDMNAGNVSSWYKKRFVRILIPYTILYILYIIATFDGASFSPVYTLLNYSTLTYWTHHDAAWFIALLIPLYFVAPLIFRLQNSGNGVFYLSGIIALLYLFSTVDLPDDKNNVLFNIQFAVERAPSFFLGMLIAPFVMRGEKISIIYWLFLPMLCFGIMACLGGYSMWLTLIPFLVISCLIIDKLPKFIVISLTFCGVISLESYLTNVWVGHYLNSNSDYIDNTGWNINNYLMYFLVILIGLGLAYCVNRMVKTHLVK